MNNKTLRVIIILAAISLAGLVWLQVYWVRRDYQFADEQFNSRVNLALMSVANQVNNYNKDSTSVREPVSQAATNYFVVDVTGIVSPDHLQNLLLIEFERYSIDMDFQFVIYDCFADSIQWRSFVDNKSDNSGPILSEPDSTSLPQVDFQADSHKFGVYFPRKNTYVLQQMGVMMYSTIGVFVIVMFFSYIVLIVFRQKRLSEMKNDFINNMTHEFKTPIATISVSSEALSKDTTLNNPDRVRTYARIIQDESQRLKGQVDQILNIAMLDSVKKKLKKTTFGFNEMIREVVEKMKIRAEDASCIIEMKLEAANANVHGDKDHLTNVIFNLLDNALKYSTEKPHIVIRSYNKGSWLVVEVQDNGIGIPPESQKFIFEKFYRVPTGNVHNVKGFGLGLNYVQQIVLSHGGKISLKSAPGSGTIFTFRLKSIPS